MIGIRKVSIADLQNVAVLFNQYRVFYGKQADIAQASEFLKDRINNNDSVIFVAERDGTLVGFTQLYPLYSSTRMKKLWLLNDLFVDVNYRGQGISIQLIERCKELCRETGACGMYLETAKINTVGNRLYPRAGFVLNDEHNFYNWDVER